MLRHLHIENVAVVKSADVDFSDGLSVLTGETGAGKSVIIDSIKLLTGRKVSRDLIRSGEEFAFCEALFDGIGEGYRKYLSDIGIDIDDDELLLCVRLGTDGRTLAKINGKTVTKTILKAVGDKMISIHGQNDSTYFADAKNYVDLIDGYASCNDLRAKYGNIYAEICKYRESLNSLTSDNARLRRERDMLEFQIKEIESAHLKVGEEEYMSEELKKLENSERINKHVHKAYKALRGDGGVGAVYLTEKAVGAISQISAIVPDASELSEKLDEIKYELEDIADRIDALGIEFDGDPTERIDKIHARLEKINKLKRKYGANIEEILKFLTQAKSRLDEIDTSDELCEKYRDEIKKLSSEAYAVAGELSLIRQTVAKEISEKTGAVLRYLDMPAVRFEILVNPGENLYESGCDKVEFTVATNVGEPLKPMTEIVSGGELSRITLALRSVLNQKDDIGCAIYDEVDTGISGKTSRKIGMKLKEISRSSQIICVTHSAQIATLADYHFLISKNQDTGRALSDIRLLSKEERIEEAARILGGINITDAQRQAAMDMLSERIDLEK